MVTVRIWTYMKNAQRLYVAHETGLISKTAGAIVL